MIDDTPAEYAFRLHVRSLLVAGVKPTPKVLEQAGYGSRNGLGGKRSTIRIEEFERANWVRDKNGRWVKKP